MLQRLAVREVLMLRELEEVYPYVVVGVDRIVGVSYTFRGRSLS